MKELIIAFFVLMFFSSCGTSEENGAVSCVADSGESMLCDSVQEVIYDSECAEVGEIKDLSHLQPACIKGCNAGTATWWFDLVPYEEKPGCNPACVVDLKTKTAEVNWRCTGLIQE